MELRVLRYFLAVVREGSITAAANSLHITQPTLSRQLKELEEELGQKLFVRSNHKTSLTLEGMFLRRRAEEILDIVNKTEAEFGSMGEIVSGDIYIGSGETVAMQQIAQVIKELRDDFPQVRYHLFSGNAEDVTERLDKGMLDFGILIEPVDMSKYDYMNLPVKDVWGVVMRKDAPLAGKEGVTRRDLLNLPLICSRQAIAQTSGKNEYFTWFGGNLDKFNIVATYNLIYNAAFMVEKGIGYAVALDKLIHVMDNSELCFRPLEPRLESGLSVVWKKYQVFTAAADIFLERIRRKFSSFEY